MTTESVIIETTPAYVAHPSSEVKGGLIVIHEVWGLVEHVKDVAERFADEGYLAVAPDLLSNTGLTLDSSIFTRTQNPTTRDEAQKEMRAAMVPIQAPEFAEQTVAKLRATVAWLASLPGVKGKVAVVGFCFGGTYAFALATAEPTLGAAVSFYGHAPTDLATIQTISCPVLAFNGKEDTRLMNELPQLIDNAEAANLDFTHIEYPNAGHAFFNDQNQTLYRVDAAKDAWVTTLTFLKDHLAST